ncbi:MAG TPA: SIR2 family protein [Blastocatellia bacterium]|nr:SIR2 family protein [Blastocatellia bacterium]
MPDTLDKHYDSVSTAIAEDEVIPFFGAGVNLCDRPDDLTWRPGCPYLPSGGELAEHLAEKYHYSWSDKQDLARVSQYAAIMMGDGSLYKELRRLFIAKYEPTALHRFFATLPRIRRQKNYATNGLLIVTTNYDDMMERAFKEAGEDYDLVTYVSEVNKPGRFWHLSPDGKVHIIDKPNKYRGLSLEKRSIILKIHGAIDRENSKRDSFVITEDNYIDYLARTDISNLIPATVAAELSDKHFLFLGYSLRDWNLRVLLHRIWREQARSFKSWAILLNAETYDQEFWRKREVDIYDLRLEDYIATLAERVKSLPAKEV